MNTFAAIRLIPLAVLLSLGSHAAWAQASPAGAQDSQLPPGSREQKIEHIVHEDGGSRIEETRYGGVTQSIIVESKLGGAPYQIVPADGTRNIAPGWNNVQDSAGKAHWQIRTF